MSGPTARTFESLAEYQDFLMHQAAVKRTIGLHLTVYEKDTDFTGALMTQWLQYFQENSLAK